MSESDLDEIEEFMDDNVEYGNISYIDLLYKIKDIREREYGDKISAPTLREFNFLGYLGEEPSRQNTVNDSLGSMLGNRTSGFFIEKKDSKFWSKLSKWEVKMKELPND